MKILVAPLNWGLGHASRCVPLIARFCREGHEVVLGGDGDALVYLQQHFPQLRSIELAHLDLRYSAGRRQVVAMLIALPKLIAFSIRDHRLLKRLQAVEHFDQVISDNRFGLYLSAQRSFSDSGLPAQRSASAAVSVYITHQLHIMLPRPYKWLEPLVSRMHACIYNRYGEVWVPDTPDHRLSGELSTLNSKLVGFSQLSTLNNSTLYTLHSTLNFIGPLSRFTTLNSQLSTTLHSTLSTLNSYKAVALFSGLEPHRTLFEKAILERFRGRESEVLMVDGKLSNQLSDSELAYYLTHAEKIICRSGYSTIMDLDALGVLDKAELIPTPGQPEQEYLALRFGKK